MKFLYTGLRLERTATAKVFSGLCLHRPIFINHAVVRIILKQCLPFNVFDFIDLF